MEWLSIHDRYALGQVIGKGGTGTVYVGLRLPEHEIVAIKLLDITDSQAEINRFIRSAKVSLRLRHPNLCEIQDYGFCHDAPPGNGRAFLAMELVAGESVAKLLEQEWPLGDNATRIRAAVRIATQALLGIQAAHEQGIIHRDLKPSNVIADPIGQLPAKVIDFDNLRIRDQGSYTRPNLVRGSAYYFSPEQVICTPEQDHRVDIWAMGVLMYEMLTRKHPFEGKTRRDVMEKIAAGIPFEPPHTSNPLVSADLEAIIARALSRHPEDRYQSAEEMGEAITALDLDDAGPLPIEQMEFETAMLKPLRDLDID